LNTILRDLQAAVAGQLVFGNASIHSRAACAGDSECCCVQQCETSKSTCRRVLSPIDCRCCARAGFIRYTVLHTGVGLGVGLEGHEGQWTFSQPSVQGTVAPPTCMTINIV
jgi:hypothetical protein